MGPGAPSGHRTGGGGRAGSAPHGGAGAVRSGRWGARAARSGRGRLAALCRKAPAFPANFYWDAEAARAASLGYRWRRLRVPVRAARAGRSGAASGGPSGPTSGLGRPPGAGRRGAGREAAVLLAAERRGAACLIPGGPARPGAS